jgi:hypothetical protein
VFMLSYVGERDMTVKVLLLIRFSMLLFIILI